MKVFMLWDMEGASGIVAREQVWYWEEGVPPEAAARGKSLLTADVSCTVTALLGAGVDELIVCDTHHGGGNVSPEAILQDPRVTFLPKSRGRQGSEFRWLPGLDEATDALMLPGHHARAGTPGAFLPHTWMGAWADFRINGHSVGEIGIEACFAGHFGVPLALVQGDEAACAEAEALCPGVVTACVKRAESADACSGNDPASARELTARKAVEAVEKARAGELAPYAPDLPMSVAIRMRTADGAEAAARRPGVTRTDEFTVEGRVERCADVVKWILGTGLQMQEAGT